MTNKFKAHIPRITTDQTVPCDPSRARIIIPARDEAKTILQVLKYLASLGFGPNQILVIVNGVGKKATMKAALKGKLARVIDFDGWRIPRLESMYNLPPNKFQGKGAALLLGCILLMQDPDLAPDDPVLLLDGDLLGLKDRDPAGRLLGAFQHFQREGATVQVVKPAALAFSGRYEICIGEYESPNHIAFNTVISTDPLYYPLAALQWPNAGLACFRWSALRSLRSATGFACDMALMMSLLDQDPDLKDFGEVEMGFRVLHRDISEEERRFMVWQIGKFMRSLDSRTISHGLGSHDAWIARGNKLENRTGDYWFAPEVHYEWEWERDAHQWDVRPQQNRLETWDAILPSPSELHSRAGDAPVIVSV
ncbi:hypothetical protein HY733_02920 [Candidatus Uhrbacteria bacterium]|nr:hypothetical protein [Candidatus Uhrbacteria bacterium]